MKKILSVFLMAFVVMSSVFATLPNAVGPVSTIGTESASVDVEFTLKPAQMYFYSFGFTDSDVTTNLGDSKPDTSPASTTKLELDHYDPATSIASNSTNKLYLYYKAKTNQAFKFTIELGGNMSSNAGELGWNATITKAQTAGVSDPAITQEKIYSEAGSEGNPTSTELSISPLSESDIYGLYSIAVATDPIPMLSFETAFSGSITMTIGTV